MRSGHGIIDDFDVFIFDWDGTLASMRALLRLSDSYKRIFARKSDISKYLMAEKSPKTPSAKAVIRHEEEKNDFLSVLYDMFFSFNKPRLQKGSHEVVRYLRAKHKRLAILTNGKPHRVDREMKHTGMSDMFEAVVSMRSLGSMKPDPRGLLHLLKRMNVDRSRVLYIGDSIDDILAARYAGVRECAIADGFDSLATLSKLKPDYLFGNMEQFFYSLSRNEAPKRIRSRKG